MSLRILVLVLVSGFTSVATAADPPARDPFVIPSALRNEKLATDGAPPQPVAAPAGVQSYTTLHSLGFEWDLGLSDTDHDATCRVEYRRADEPSWHEALPLFRVDYAGWYADRKADKPYNMFAGSVMFLRPGTEYVAKLTLVDPDGGVAVKEVTLHTRPVPDFGTPSRTLHVVPRGNDADVGDGSPKNPLRGIEAADKIAQPGDLFLVHAGEYGQATFSRSGAKPAGDSAGDQGKYIVWKSAGDGDAKFYRAQITGSHVWLEGLAFVRGGDKMGLRTADGANDNVVRACTFRGYGYAIFLEKTVRGWYIADNDIIGDDAGGISGEGIELNHSSDHTVCYNRATKTADGTSYCRRNCDIFANDFFGYSDDGVEPDYGYANNRIWGNRLDGEAGITFQAMFCGPWYIVRNQIVSSSNIFKLRVQDRYLLANNTLIGYNAAAGAKLPHAHGILTAMTRNNLWIHGGGSPYLWGVQAPAAGKAFESMQKNVLFSTLRADWRTDVDYDGFDWSSALKGKNGKPTPFNWNGARLEDLSMLAEQVGVEKHGIVVDKEQIFTNYAPPPYDAPHRVAFTLKPDGKAVDAGVSLPNIAEEFTGRAPDLGAIEAGTSPPTVGPRMGDDWRKRHDEWVLRHQRGD